MLMMTKNKSEVIMKRNQIINRLSEVTDIIQDCERVLGNPAAFFGDDEEWDAIIEDKQNAEKEQNRLLKKLGFNCEQDVVDSYRVAYQENDTKTMNKLDQIVDAIGVIWGYNTVL